MRENSGYLGKDPEDLLCKQIIVKKKIKKQIVKMFVNK